MPAIVGTSDHSLTPPLPWQPSQSFTCAAVSAMTATGLNAAAASTTNVRVRIIGNSSARNTSGGPRDDIIAATGSGADP